MIDVHQLRKGTTFTLDGDIYKVINFQHHKPGRGKATIRTTLRNLRTGATIQHNFISSDRVEDIRVERRGVQYLYTDGDLYYFMDTETYDQTPLSGAVLGDEVVIYPNCYVGRHCRIGDRTVVHANVSIHDRVSIGADCIIHYNAVIGSEGFGFLQREGANVKLPQVGTVRIGDRVEIGALTTVDRATLDATVIEDGVKVDNHCHIAHNCHIGPDCILAGYAKLAGSVRLGRGVICAEDVGVTDHVTVGDGAILGASAGVPSDVEPGAVVLGTPARPIADQRRIFAIIGRLPEMARRLRRLEKAIEDLTNAPGQGS